MLPTAPFFSAARLVAFTGVALGAAGCGGTTDSAFTGAPASTCSYLNAKIALVAPTPGSTGVLDAFPEVVIATSVAFPTTYDAVVTGNIGGVAEQIYFNTLIASALPTGSTPPPFANPTYYASTNPSVTFDPKSPISVALNDSSSTCLPGASIGTFTVR